MPADFLTLPVTQIASHVEAVLAGRTLQASADDLGVAPADLADAMETYRAAGLAALHRCQEHAWFQASVAVLDWTTAEATFAEHIGPRLNKLEEGQAAWWFLRKHPHWRLRVRTTQHQTVELILDDLVTSGIIGRWRPSTYEPEIAAFGDTTAMDTVHDLFCADSRGVLTYIRQSAPQLGRRELSLLLIRALQQQAGLDWFEAGDVFDRVAQMRPTPADTETSRVESLASRMRPLLTIPVQVDTPLFAPGGPVSFAAPWLAGFANAGQELGRAAAVGELGRGLRAIIAQTVIFHWNRLGLSAAAQGILARAAKAAIMHRS
ncbi:thiopeptide-type bacteriocin biosynthesis protein [Micromonospora sp. NPDC050397]|uniref:thiopeptide-type bacteriocin biosynthesis protein n=1 Tax=Micromonospora sp. NPDC050397 TaxID=3364279 RepID=UPI00384F4EB8